MIARPGHRPEEGLRRGDRAEPQAGRAADVRPRLQHPLQPDRPAGRRRRRDGRPQGPRPPRAQRLPGRRRRARAVRGRTRTRPAPPVPHPGLRPGDRRTRAGVLETTFKEETETDLFGEQSSCAAAPSALVKMVRDARRGRLPAGARLLRDAARAEADRRPHVPRRPQLHALQRQRHGRVRRLRQRPADHRLARTADDDAHVLTDIQDGTFAARWIAENEAGRPNFERLRAAGPRPPDRAGRRGPPQPDGRSSTRSWSRPARPRRRPAVPGEARDDARPPRPRPASAGVVPAGAVRIFDTTLRDGEQAPGAGLTAAEKLEVARQLVRSGWT
jgi:hypothetical protein